MIRTVHSSEFYQATKTNPNVNWADVPPFLPTSTSDDALKFISNYGGVDKELFEFGTWIGRSALGFSKNFKHVTTIDYINGSDISYAYQAENKSCRAGELILNVENVTFINENSLTYDFTRYNQKYDVIFVDGNHSYTGCTTDMNNALRIAKPNNSLVFVHDYGNPGMGVRAAVDAFDHPQKFYLSDIDLVVLINL